MTAPHALSVADAFHTLRSEAATVAEARAVDFRADLPLALHNARIGVDAVMPFAARIAVELPTVPLARVAALPNYVRGAMYADSLSTSPRAVTGDDIAEKLAELQEIRVPALLQLQVFKLKKMASASVVDGIVEGRGTLNFAQDGIDIEREFTSHHDAWRGKHPFTDEEIARRDPRQLAPRPCATRRRHAAPRGRQRVRRLAAPVLGAHQRAPPPPEDHRRRALGRRRRR